MRNRQIRTTRRRFLASSLAGAAVLAGQATKLHAADERKTKMRLGLVTYLWGQDWDLPTLIRNCSKARLLGVELRTTHAHGVEPSLNAEQRKAVRKRFEDSDVTLVGLGSDERFDSPDRAKLEQAIKATKAFIKLSHDVGGSGVKVKPNSFHKDVPREKTIDQIGAALQGLGKFAADHGQEIRLEVHGQCAELPTIKAIMDRATHPAVGVCWNSNAQDLAGKGLEHNFGLVAKRFGKTAHVRELDGSKYPYAKLMKLFVGIDYDGWVLLEARGKPKDRVAAMIEQRRAFERLVAAAQSS